MKRTKKPKRKRTKFRVIKNTTVRCSEYKVCWYKGACPHRGAHIKSKLCEENFCSIMQIHGCKCEEV